MGVSKPFEYEKVSVEAGRLVVADACTWDDEDTRRMSIFYYLPVEIAGQVQAVLAECSEGDVISIHHTLSFEGATVTRVQRESKIVEFPVPASGKVPAVAAEA